MTIQYKNQGFVIDSTNAEEVFVCPTSGVAIVKSVKISNDAAVDALVKGALVDSSTLFAHTFFIDTLTSDSSTNMVSNVLNLEAGDKINIQSSQGGSVIQGVISYALIDRSQENG